MSDLIPAAIAGDLESGRKASNLAFALGILPAERRRDALIFYRFCRILDDIADSPKLSPAEKTLSLNAWEHALGDPSLLPEDIAGIVRRNGIDITHLREILLGVRADLTIRRYATFTEARQYCWRVASAVGLVSIRIFGCKHPGSEAYAESLGLALQWTNIIRDVGEDAGNDRIYLPLEDLTRFGVAERALLGRESSPAFRELMTFEADRARGFFEEAHRALPSEDRRALLPAEIMRATYGCLLERMTRDGFPVLDRRYRLHRLEKLWLAARVFLATTLSR